MPMVSSSVVVVHVHVAVLVQVVVGVVVVDPELGRARGVEGQARRLELEEQLGGVHDANRDEDRVTVRDRRAVGPSR